MRKGDPARWASISALALCAEYLQPAPGQIWSSNLISVLRQTFKIWCRSSSLASSMLPSVFIDNEVRTSANRVALKFTDPSELRGMFMETSRWNGEGRTNLKLAVRATHRILWVGKLRQWRFEGFASRCGAQSASAPHWPCRWSLPFWSSGTCGSRQTTWPWNSRSHRASKAYSWLPGAENSKRVSTCQWVNELGLWMAAVGSLGSVVLVQGECRDYVFFMVVSLLALISLGIYMRPAYIGNFYYLAGHAMWTQFAESKRRRDLSEERDHVHVFDASFGVRIILTP